MNIENSQVINTRKIITGVGIMKNEMPGMKVLKPEKKINVKTEEKGLSVHKEINLVEKFFKRFLDIIGGFVGTLFLIPFTIIIFIANKITKDNGPIFYTQDRIGKDGKLFKIYKYRSMEVGADEKLEKYLAENEEAREEYRINKKLKNDPRITKVGNFIRKTSIDEFPQFINVLKGDMSLVGPRPYLPREKGDMGTYYDFIIETKPGITGYWQVNGRSEVDFAERLTMDMQYYNKSSLGLDIKLIAETVAKVAKKEGAA